jgi:hypothetical protein
MTKVDLLLFILGILNRWLNVYGVNDFGQTEIRAAEKLLPKPSALEAETATDIWKDLIRQAPFKLRQNWSVWGFKTVPSEIHKLFIFDII